MNTSDISPAELRKNLEEMLATHIFKIKFTKKDGSERTMKCTLDPLIYVPYERKTNRIRVENETTIPVWDVEGNQWRSIILANIISIEIVINE